MLLSRFARVVGSMTDGAREPTKVEEIELDLLLEGDLPQVSLRLSALLPGFATAAAGRGAAIFRLLDAVDVAEPDLARRRSVPRAAALPHRASQRPVSRRRILFYFAARARARAPHLPFSARLDRRLQHRRGGLLVRDPAGGRRPAPQHDYLRHGHQSGDLAYRRGGALLARPAGQLRREPPLVGARAVRCPSTTRLRMAQPSSTEACARRSYLRITAWRRTVASRRCSSFPVGTCSSISTAHCKIVRSVCSRIRFAVGVSWGLAHGRACASPSTTPDFTELANQWYQRC